MSLSVPTLDEMLTWDANIVRDYYETHYSDRFNSRVVGAFFEGSVNTPTGIQLGGEAMTFVGYDTETAAKYGSTRLF